MLRHLPSPSLFPTSLLPLSPLHLTLTQPSWSMALKRVGGGESILNEEQVPTLSTCVDDSYQRDTFENIQNPVRWRKGGGGGRCWESIWLEGGGRSQRQNFAMWQKRKWMRQEGRVLHRELATYSVHTLSEDNSIHHLHTIPPSPKIVSYPPPPSTNQWEKHKQINILQNAYFSPVFTRSWGYGADDWNIILLQAIYFMVDHK